MRSTSIAFASILLAATLSAGCASTPKNSDGISIATLDTAPLVNEIVTLKVFGFD